MAAKNKKGNKKGKKKRVHGKLRRNKKKSFNKKNAKIFLFSLTLVVIILVISLVFFTNGNPKIKSEVVSKEVQKQLKANSETRVLIKSSNDFGIIKSIGDGSDLKIGFLEANTSNPLEVKQIVDDYHAVEVNSKDLSELLNEFPIEEVSLDRKYGVLGFSGDEDVLKITAVSNLHNLDYNGDGIKICVVDTGVNGEVLGLRYGENLFGYNPIDNSRDFSDDNGHGTKVMSILNSVVPNSNFYVVKAIDSQGTGYSSDIASGIEWCQSQDVDVYLLSVGTKVDLDNNGYCSNDFVANKLNELVYNGSYVFAATGNDGNKNVYSPACAGLVTPVASSTKDDGISDFSNYNENTFVVAPGENVKVVDNKGVVVSSQGTSLSAPLVAGIATMYLGFDKDIDPLLLEDRLIKTGVVLEKDGKQFSRVDAYNFFLGNITNDLSRGGFSYDDFKVQEIQSGDITGGNQIFQTLTLCDSASQCSGSDLCIEGNCETACNSTFDGSRCSDDSNVYTSSSSGSCAKNSSSIYTCDKDEVGQTTGPTVHWTDCYDIQVGIPTSAYSCDVDVAPDFKQDGVCAYSSGTVGVSTVDCDGAGVCVDSSSQYRSDCSLCGDTAQYACDNDTTSGFSQSGICVYDTGFGAPDACDTGDVCINSGTYYGNMSSCSNNDLCDSDVNPNFVEDGLICIEYYDYCVVNGTIGTGNSCCNDANCGGTDTCTGGVCTAVGSCPSAPLGGAKKFTVKNSTGSVCMEINESGYTAIYGSVFESCAASPSTGAFQIKTSGGFLGWINESCDFCVKNSLTDSQTLDSCSGGDFCIKNSTGSQLFQADSVSGNLLFSGSVCSDYNSGSPIAQ